MVRDSLLSRQIINLKERLLMLGGQVEQSLTEAVSSVRNRNVDKARSVIAMDKKIDRLEVDLEEECLKILALYQPVAIDLRFIVTVLKVNNDLERIGDLAANIAEYSEMTISSPEINLVFDFNTMAIKVQSMLNSSLDALVNKSPDLAHKVIATDDDIDDIHRSMYVKIEAAMTKDPVNVGIYIRQIGLSRCMERIADLATNIAEDVIYLATGEIVRH